MSLQVRTGARKNAKDDPEIASESDGINWRHSYAGTNIDMAKTHEDARKRMDDGRWTWGTVVHNHPSGVPCKGNDHTVYDPRDKSITDKIFVDDGYQMWGIRDPWSKES